MQLYGQSASAIIAKIPGWAWGGVALILSVSFSFWLMRDQIDKWHNAETQVTAANQKVSVLQEQVTMLKEMAAEGNVERDSMRRRIAMLEERLAGM